MNKPRSSLQSIIQKRKKYGTTATLPMAGHPPKFSCPTTTTTTLVRQTTVMLTVTERPKSATATENDVHGSKTFKQLLLKKNGLYGVWPTRTDLRLFFLKSCWHFSFFFFFLFSFMVYSFIYFWAAHTNKTALSICMLDTCWLWLEKHQLSIWQYSFNDICTFLINQISLLLYWDY